MKMEYDPEELGTLVRYCIGYSLVVLPPAYEGHSEMVETRAFSDGSVEVRKHYGGYQEYAAWMETAR